MASKPARLHSEAGLEYLEALAWYRDRSVVVALDFELAINEAVRVIEAAPQRWPIYFGEFRRYRLHSFSVQYRISGNAFRSLFSQSPTAGVGQGTGENELKFECKRLSASLVYRD